MYVIEQNDIGDKGDITVKEDIELPLKYLLYIYRDYNTV